MIAKSINNKEKSNKILKRREKILITGTLLSISTMSIAVFLLFFSAPLHLSLSIVLGFLAVFLPPIAALIFTLYYEFKVKVETSDDK